MRLSNFLTKGCTLECPAVMHCNNTVNTSRVQNSHQYYLSRLEISLYSVAGGHNTEYSRQIPQLAELMEMMERCVRAGNQ